MIRGLARARRGINTLDAAPRRRGSRAVVAVLAVALSTVVPGAVGPAAAADPSRYLTYPTNTPHERICDERVCVHRATSGPHAATLGWAQATLKRLETSWSVLVDQDGHRPPAPSPSSDGDERFHVYLADTAGQGHFGQTVFGSAVPGHPRRAHSYLVIDNDMAGLPGDRQANLAATVAHEFFHALQLNRDASEDQWFMEASATWAETRVFPLIPANRRYLDEGQLADRRTPLDSLPSAYGNFLLLERLTTLAGPTAVREVWDRLDASNGARDEYSLQALAAVLATRGITWESFYSGFAVANVFPRHHYPARARGASGRSDTTVTLGTRRKAFVQASRQAHLSARTTTFRVSKKSRKRNLSISVQSSVPARTSAVLVVVRRDGTLRTVPLKLNRSGKARATVRYSRSKVSRLVLVTSNTSRAFRNCDSWSGWSCGGDPVHDRTRVEVRARLR